jgi:hypothetical protein
MKRTVIDCDKCGKETESAIEIVIPNGTHRYNDGVESNIDFLFENKDLCPDCAKGLLSYMFRHKKNFDVPDDKPPQLYRAKTHQHPNAGENDAIKLALMFFGIKERT